MPRVRRVRSPGAPVRSRSARTPNPRAPDRPRSDRGRPRGRHRPGGSPHQVAAWADHRVCRVWPTEIPRLPTRCTPSVGEWREGGVAAARRGGKPPRQTRQTRRDHDGGCVRSSPQPWQNLDVVGTSAPQRGHRTVLDLAAGPRVVGARSAAASRSSRPWRLPPSHKTTTSTSVPARLAALRTKRIRASSAAISADSPRTPADPRTGSVRANLVNWTRTIPATRRRRTQPVAPPDPD